MSLIITEGMGEEGDVIPGPVVEPPGMIKAKELRPKMIYGGEVALAIVSTKAGFILAFYLSKAILESLKRIGGF